MGVEPASDPPFAEERSGISLRAAQVTIVGLGLIGGSLALALREGRVCRAVYGVARRPDTIAEALKRGAIDSGTTVLAEGVADADVVILAAPVCTIIRLIPEVGSLAKAGCMLFDVGSTKQAIVEAMEQLPPHVQAIGGHPMCGKETNGLLAAEATLFQGATFVFTPLSRTGQDTLRLAKELTQAIGARPLVMDARRHDRLAAAVSHLPYALSAGLMAVAREMATRDEAVWRLAASGFRDCSRLAASDVTMMTDILMTNREALLEVASAMKSQLDNLMNLISRGDKDALQSMLLPLQRQRSQMFQRGKS